jgi:hypothetical protein
MNKQEALFAKALFEATISLVPGGGNAKAFAAPLFDRMTATTDITSIEQASKKQAVEITRYYLALEEAGYINKGSGHAAAADFSAIIGKATITPRMLIEFNLETDQLWQYLLKTGEAELAEASQGRRSRVIQGLKDYAEALIQAAAELPTVRLEFMRAMLKRLPAAKS